MSRKALHTHLATGVTHSCRAWAVKRKDGVRFAFTDHDRPLQFGGYTFSPQGGLSTRAMVRSTGLSVDNTAAMGVLSDDRITDTDIVAGRFDGAEVTIWLVQWDQVAAREILFRGAIGEISRSDGAFEAELVGLAAPLNQPVGRTYMRTCDAGLGDAACGIALTGPEFMTDQTLVDDLASVVFPLEADGFAEGWFSQGICEVLSGPAKGLRQAILADETVSGTRLISLWAPFEIVPQTGDQLRLTAGCDKRAETCRDKFANFLNFRGFPDMPGDDWLMSVPRTGASNTGRSLVR
ncbi:DUF2163 domain-containing protein [Yoonia litorea]|uniref:Bacteriophage phiJL001 Gp84 C-terminal domain-containing protein n=1 Tax=Yoonia litorea TaxID=1123755 RepID=A0A1I6LXJ2_9RHOB|nr:DUF2163 domain-containing protein [Yoonia litorea]SFS08115.1 phage conserved hypothetical protein BR0599 [Yoonia litorea]